MAHRHWRLRLAEGSLTWKHPEPLLPRCSRPRSALCQVQILERHRMQQLEAAQVVLPKYITRH